MEQIGRMYGKFILEGIAVAALAVFLFYGIAYGGEWVGLLEVIGDNLPEENKAYDTYIDFKEVYKGESTKAAPQIRYVTGAVDAGRINLTQVIKAFDYAGVELKIDVLSIKNMEEEELIEHYDTETMEIELKHPGIYTILVRTTDDGNRTTQCSIRMPINSRVIQEEEY